jgi:hypothetical protein
MYYEVFPFGKYKGVKLKDLPSTYIVLSLEQFELPIDLHNELRFILLGRLNVYSSVKNLSNDISKKRHIEILDKLITQYENK